MGAYILSIESGDRKIPRAYWPASPASSVVRDPASKLASNRVHLTCCSGLCMCTHKACISIVTYMYHR